MAKPTFYTKQGTDKAIAKAIEPLATKEELARASAGGKIDLGEYAKRTDLAPPGHTSRPRRLRNTPAGS